MSHVWPQRTHYAATFCGEGYFPLRQIAMQHTNQYHTDLEGPEPSAEADRWVEVNDCHFLFHRGQSWTREDARTFAVDAWNYLGFD